jgi:8-oxo-dGTP pyrophosphatase MutT (NUDIX family)
MVIKEPTASTFVFRREAGTWLTALVWHPRLDCWLPSGGHVEVTENTEEAAIREAREETGLDVQLLPGPAAPVPAGYPHKVLCAPWWITEMRASPDSHTASPHVHVDHFFAAVASSAQLASAPAHTVRWFSRSGVTEEPGISQDSRLQVLELLALI